MKRLKFSIDIYDWDVEIIQATSRDAKKLERLLLESDVSNSDTERIINNLTNNLWGGDHFWDRIKGESLILLSNCDVFKRVTSALFHELRHLEDRILETMSIEDTEASACLSSFIAKNVIPKFFKLK